MTEARPPAPEFTYPAPAPANPGTTMGIISLVLSIIGLHVVGIILGFVALSQSKRVGQSNGFALAGVIVGFVLLALSIVVIGLAMSGGVAFWGFITEACRDLGSGVWVVDGITYSCP